MGVQNDYGFPFTDQAGDRKYNSQTWREFFNKLVKNGIIQNDGNMLQVKPQGTPNKTVYVDTGTIVINGAMRIITSAITPLTCADNTSGNPRIDRIVAKLDYTNRQITFAVKQGTPAASPVAPAVQRDSTFHELALADITLANGYTTITSAVITDQRWDTTLCGASSMTIGVIPPSGHEAVTIVISEALRTIMGLSQADANVEKALMVTTNLNMSSYQAFCANVNTASLDAAFGKGNEGVAMFLGKQLAMYAYYKGVNPASYPFTNLSNGATLTQILANPVYMAELLECIELYNLIQSSPYAKALFDASGAATGDTFCKDMISSAIGEDKTQYASMTALLNNATAVGKVLNSSRVMMLVSNSAKSTAMLTGNANAMSTMCGSTTYLNIAILFDRITASMGASTNALYYFIRSDKALSAFVKATSATPCANLDVQYIQDNTATLQATLGTSAMFTKTTPSYNTAFSTKGAVVSVLKSATAYNSSWTKTFNYQPTGRALLSGVLSSVSYQAISIGGQSYGGNLSSGYSTFTVDLYTAV